MYLKTPDELKELKKRKVSRMFFSIAYITIGCCLLGWYAHDWRIGVSIWLIVGPAITLLADLTTL